MSLTRTKLWQLDNWVRASPKVQLLWGVPGVQWSAVSGLLHIGLHSLRPVRMPMLTPDHHRKSQQWAREHSNWMTEQWKKVAWSDESHFLWHHMDGQLCVRHLPGEHVAPECTMRKRQVSGGSAMVWEMFCLKTLGPTIHVDVTLTRTTYLKALLQTMYTLSWKHYSLMAVASFSRIMHHATKQKWLRNGLRSTMSLRCWLGFQIPQTSIQSSICEMCWTNKSDPWRPHLATYRTWRICC